MLYLYIGLGAIFLICIFIIGNHYLNRKKRYKKKLDYFLQNNDFLNAIEFANKLISIYKENPGYYFLLADIYQKAKIMPKAVEIYKKMLKEKIFSPKIKEHNIREKLAIIDLNNGKIIEAFHEFYTISKSNPTAIITIGMLGQIYGSQRKYDKAIELLKKAISLESDNAEFHYQLGMAYLDTGELILAIQELDKAIQYDPAHVKVQYFLALACKQKGLYEKAKMLFNKLNLKDTSQLPENILEIGIMTQNAPVFEIDVQEEKIDKELGDVQVKAKDLEKVTSIEELLHANIDLFRSTAMNIMNKMGYIIKKEVKTNLTDSSSEIDFIAVPKKDKDKLDASKYFVQFTKTNSEIGTIPFADFLSKVHELKMSNGILVITSSFSPQIPERAKKEKGTILLVDVSKLARYL